MKEHPSVMKIIIPLCPVTKKNSQRIFVNRKTKRPFISPSEKFLEYEKAASRYLTGYKVDEYPVNVKLLFYMPNKRKCDLTNLIEAIDDVLVKTGVLPDDNYNIISAHDGSRVYVDKDSPRTEIYIEKNQEKEG